MLTAAYVGDRTVELIAGHAGPPGPAEVQVRVAYVGLCGTDLHITHGDMDRRVTTPLVFGHEMSGTVERVGSDVVGWSPGEAVTVMPLVWDGTCPACRAGHTHVCQNLTFIGIDSPGALQQLWNVPASTLVRVGDGLDLRDAALIEPTAVAVHDVRRGSVDAGDKVVILGGGPIGTLIATVAERFGASAAVVEPDDDRRALVETLGFVALDPKRQDVRAWVDTWTEGTGADVVFEVSGATSAVAMATDLPKVRGTVVVVAIHPEPRPLNLQRVFWRELLVVGARVYDRSDFETAISLLREGTVPADALISQVVPLDRVPAALDDLAGGRAMKILVDVRAGQGVSES